MKTIKLYFAILFFVTITTDCFCQLKSDKFPSVYKTENPDKWPLAFDAFLAAPENHKILLENDKVRIFEIKILPGDTENLHHHRYPGVLYIQHAASFISYNEDENIIFDTRNLEEPLTFPLALYKNSETLHKIENLSKTEPICMIRVEMK